MELLWNFHQDPISGSLSRHQVVSSWSPFGHCSSDKHPSEVSVKVSSRSCIRNPVKTPPVLKVYSWILEWHGGSGWTWSWCPISLFLESSRTWQFLMKQEVVSDDMYHTSEASVEVLSTSKIRDPVKTPPVLQVSSWSHGGQRGSWWTWSWCQILEIIFQKLLWKFHQDPTSGTLSRLLLSSKSLLGVMEVM